MPLVPQQKIVAVKAHSVDNAVMMMEVKLREYPDCRIISISISPAGGINMPYVDMVAVIETV